MNSPSLEVSGKHLFQYYLEGFFKIPKDISHDIIYCQRALKAHIKVHQVSECVAETDKTYKM